MVMARGHRHIEDGRSRNI